jgi:hypothetical protein
MLLPNIQSSPRGAKSASIAVTCHPLCHGHASSPGRPVRARGVDMLLAYCRHDLAKRHVRALLAGLLAAVVVSFWSPSSTAQECAVIDKGQSQGKCVNPTAACKSGGLQGVCTNRGVKGEYECDCNIPSGSSGGTGGKGPGDQPYFIATVGNAIWTPEFVNLYWDDRWDLDNPTLPKASIDAFTAAMASSSYFTSPIVSGPYPYLSEYGVQSATFGGGFLPAAPCTQRSPSRPGYWDPIAPSIMGFLQCEIHNAGVPTGGNVIYNIILPAYAFEQDLLGNRTFCNGGHPVSWHFHDTPYDPAVTAAIAGSSLLSIPDMAILLGLLVGLHNGPVWTITMTSPSCGSFTTNLLHEMVEATTDPFPPLSVVTSGNGEIVDQCESTFPGSGTINPAAGASTHPFVVPASIGSPPPGGGSVAFATPSIIAVPAFWSNLWQTCELGFGDLTVPGSPIVKIVSGQGGTLSMTIAASSGSFGFLPPSFPAGNTVTLPYIGLQDLTQGWQAGNSLDSNFITLNISWPSPTGPPPQTIAVTGVGHPGTDFTMKSGDQLAVWVCNPQSGNCAATSGSAISAPAGPYLPNLAVALAVFQSQVIAPYVTFSIDGKPVGSLFGDGNSTGWMTLGIGTHTVSASVPADTSGLYKVSYTGACNAKGIVTLNEGDNRTCDISVMSSLTLKSTGCATGETCCEAGVTKCSICMRVPPHGSCP